VQRDQPGRLRAIDELDQRADLGLRLGRAPGEVAGLVRGAPVGGGEAAVEVDVVGVVLGAGEHAVDVHARHDPGDAAGRALDELGDQSLALEDSDLLVAVDRAEDHRGRPGARVLGWIEADRGDRSAEHAAADHDLLGHQRCSRFLPRSVARP
jgi:hypothetical protein